MCMNTISKEYLTDLIAEYIYENENDKYNRLRGLYAKEKLLHVYPDGHKFYLCSYNDTWEFVEDFISAISDNDENAKKAKERLSHNNSFSLTLRSFDLRRKK